LISDETDDIADPEERQQAKEARRMRILRERALRDAEYRRVLGVASGDDLPNHIGHVGSHVGFGGGRRA